MTPYRHSQFSMLNIFAVGFPGVICLVLYFTLNITGGFQYMTLGLGLLFLGIAYCFHSLTVEVDEENIRIRFGPGLIKRSWPVSDCIGARATRTRLIDGWGIRLTREGWLYNISIPHAVLVRFENGKAIQLGTDEPEALLAAMLEAGLSLEES